jgi:hypothetical protein
MCQILIEVWFWSDHSFMPGRYIWVGSVIFPTRLIDEQNQAYIGMIFALAQSIIQRYPPPALSQQGTVELLLVISF